MIDIALICNRIGCTEICHRGQQCSKYPLSRGAARIKEYADGWSTKTWHCSKHTERVGDNNDSEEEEADPRYAHLPQ